MAATILKFRLFLGSYAVLFAILAIRFTGHWLPLVCGTLAVVGFADTWRIATAAGSKEPQTYKVEEVRDRGPEVAGYLATYLLPFVTVAAPSVRDLLGYTLFLVVSAVVYVRSEMVQINPALYLIGRRVVSVRTGAGRWVYLVTRREPEVGTSIDAVSLRGDVVVVRVNEVDGDGEDEAA